MTCHEEFPSIHEDEFPFIHESELPTIHIQAYIVLDIDCELCVHFLAQQHFCGAKLSDTTKVLCAGHQSF